MVISLGLEEAAFLLIAAGLICVVFWLAAPAIWRIVAGLTLLTFGLVGIVALPVGAAGVLLLTFAAALLCMEVLAYPGCGLHAFGGGISLLLAGSFLTGEWSGAHPAVVIPSAVGVAVAAYFAGRRSWRRIRNKPLDPFPKLVGRRTIVLSCTGSVGLGVIGGELWQLRAGKGALEQGQTVQIVEARDECLVVEPTSGIDFS
jgi:membrane-bound ClpP family serine protease